MREPRQTASDEELRRFFDGVEPAGRREDAIALDHIFREVTGFTPVLWGTMVGYGRYEYTYASGHSGESLATGFAPRKGNMVLYIMPGYADFGDILDRLGPYKKGKACLYLGRISKLERDALCDLIREGLIDLGTRWKIHPS